MPNANSKHKSLRKIFVFTFTISIYKNDLILYNLIDLENRQIQCSFTG